jgi:hypothetical protein
VAFGSHILHGRARPSLLMAYPYSHFGGGTDKTIALAIAVGGVLITLPASGSASESAGMAPGWAITARKNRQERHSVARAGGPLPDSAPAFCGDYMLRPTSR